MSAIQQSRGSSDDELDRLSTRGTELNLAGLADLDEPPHSKKAPVLAREDEWIASLDLDAFALELKTLGKTLAAQQGDADVRHLDKIVAWQRACTAFGVATMGLVAYNPLAIFALSTGVLTRWTIVAHHVCHGGFDKCETKGRYNRFTFGVGSTYRRCVDWLDWMLVEAWNVEHNQLHHYSLGEDADPDLVERNLANLREMPAVLTPLKYAVVAFLIVTWKWFYYAPNTFKVLSLNQMRRRDDPRLAQWSKEWQEEACVVGSWAVWWNFGKYFTNVDFFGRVLGPFFVVRFLLLPALVAAAAAAAASVGLLSSAPAVAAAYAGRSSLINLVAAELLTNAHAFLVVATNHCGDDLYRFEGHATPRSPTFFMRQVVSSVNFATGDGKGGQGHLADVVDFLQGWLNYQIEHHLWPDLSMLSYQKAQPLVRDICKRHGVPYVQESVWVRFVKTVSIIGGRSSMRRFPAQYNSAKDVVS
eukprot:CAMPEP_0183353006 /NCGR_PEP_ID=MMETSP0164_2-20130417/32067_1 /TAXON_ID=221442 /ORGANISM="Coccolithus pelagicus ssp braarudi, Strain PLY182g" /LENGTH=473 /DNA_ID=CAMNT_0025525597 /DNA_START=31 /DNA_END=1452 /DNA_ORIENTATION=+